jgi:hypothetical protein
MEKFIEHSLKLLIGFAVVMVMLYLVYIAKTYPEQVGLFFMLISGLVECYLLGACIWNTVVDFCGRRIE